MSAPRLFVIQAGPLFAFLLGFACLSVYRSRTEIARAEAAESALAESRAEVETLRRHVDSCLLSYQHLANGLRGEP